MVLLRRIRKVIDYFYPENDFTNCLFSLNIKLIETPMHIPQINFIK